MTSCASRRSPVSGGDGVRHGEDVFGEQREFCRCWHNQTEVTVKGLHFLQGDSGPEIGAAIAAWARR
jgi:hypothetical protein